MRSLIAFFLLLSIPSSFALGAPVKTKHVTAELLLESKNVVAGANWVGLKLEMIPHWHTYWRFPGDSGLPTEVKWKLPEGWKMGEALWPLPERLFLPPLVNFGYEGAVLVAFPLSVPAGTAEGSQVIHASVSWLVCKEECIPEKAELELPVKVSRVPGGAGPITAEFARLRAAQAVPLPSSVKVAAVDKEKLFGLALEGLGDGPEKLDFLPLAPQIIKGTAPVKVEKTKAGLILWMEKAEPFDASALTLPGLLLAGAQTYDISLSLTPAFAPPASEAPKVPIEQNGGILLPLFFAFLGGLVLNLMPCVFPVLGIKVMSLVRQGGRDKRHTRSHGRAYAFGVIASFWGLGAALLALRSAGEAAGWGFQLQHPGFVVLLVLLFSFVTADLAGFIHWSGRWMGAGSSLANRDGWSGSFFTGMLAVLVATPCTAPFMGTAMGAVIGQPALVVLAVFTALGFGLALPFLFLCHQPDLVALLPKPGLWMERLKELFAFPMAGTVLWLLWVLGMQCGGDGVLKVQLGLLLLAVALWMGQRFHTSSSRAFTLLFLLAGLGLSYLGASGTPAEAGLASGGWKPFSEEALAEAIKEKKPVFVDFTAAWCLTCQVNKKIVLDRAATQDFFRSKGVVLLLADWTNRNEAITRALESHGRIGVPLYLAYHPGEAKPELLPQILTESRVRAAFP